MDAHVILDTRIIESVWRGGPESEWVSLIVSRDTQASVSSLSVAEAVRRIPDRRAEIQLMALLSMVDVIDVSDEIARRAGGIARELESDDPSLMPNAVVAATALEADLPVACVDDDFFEAMGCKIASPG
jgi:predicted nucleic acid-binding protein